MDPMFELLSVPQEANPVSALPAIAAVDNFRNERLSMFVISLDHYFISI